jgi:hypothetical protein
MFSSLPHFLHPSFLPLFLLQILMTAFARNGIEYVRLESGGKKEAIVRKFIEDPDVAAFFLVRDEPT